MTSSHLIQWIQHPETLDKESLYELRTLLARYPYFQTLRLLYLKNLYLLHDATFGEELRKSVLYVADRRQLFYQIEGARYYLHPHQPAAVTGQAMDESVTDRTIYLIDSFLSTVPDEQAQTTDLDYAMDYTTYLLAVTGQAMDESVTDRTIYLIDSFLSTVPDEQAQTTDLDYAMDYTTYLLAQTDGVESAASTVTEETPLLRGQDLIDSFLSRADEPLLSLEEVVGASAVAASIEKNMQSAEQIETKHDCMAPTVECQDSSEGAALPAQISAAKEISESETVSETDAVCDTEMTVCLAEHEDETGEEERGEFEETPSEDETFTETLAKIYVKQHRYDKALEIIKKLSLNYPKKNAYFADQIRFLEKLIINAKSK